MMRGRPLLVGVTMLLATAGGVGSQVLGPKVEAPALPQNVDQESSEMPTKVVDVERVWSCRYQPDACRHLGQKRGDEADDEQPEQECRSHRLR